MHILIVNQWHRQPGRAGPARVNELAAQWTRLGCEVTVLTTTVDHQSSKVPDIYAGRFTTEERAEGARVLRCWTLAKDKTVTSGRIARDLSFACTSGIAGLLKVRRPDLVLASSPPLFVALPAMALSRIWRVPLVFEARDLWPDVAVEYGVLGGRSACLAYVLEDMAYRASERIVVVTPGFKDRLLEKGVAADKVSVIPNGVDLDTFHPGDPDPAIRQSYGWTGKFLVLYAGVHGQSQALAQVIHAAALLKDRQEIHFAFFGDGEDKPKLQAMVADLGLTNVEFHPQVPREQVPALLRASDAALSTLKGLPAFSRTYPAKVFEIMGSGRPIVLGADGLVGDLVREAGGGLVAPAEDHVALARTILDLYEDPAGARAMGARGAEFMARHYSRRDLAARYLELLESTVRGGLEKRSSPGSSATPAHVSSWESRESRPSPTS